MQAVRSLLRAGAVAAMLTHAPAANAQLTASLGFFAGVYHPFGHFDPASVYSTALPGQPSDLKGTAWGGTAHLGFGGRYGVAAQVAAANSQVGGGNTPEGVERPTGASVLLATVLAQYDVSPNPRAFGIWLSAGPALIRHGGDAYRPYGSPTSYGAAFGTTVAVPLGAHLQLNADVTGLFYTFDVPMPPDLRANPGRLEHGSQRDALVHLGIAWARF